MKLRPTQIIGLGAIIVFGGILIVTLTKPKRDPFSLPNGMPFSSLPTPTMPEIEIPLPDLSSIQSPPPLSMDVLDKLLVDYTASGSQPARDDLYCSGLIHAEFDATTETRHPDELSKMLAATRALDGAGLAKLRAEGISTGDDWAYFTRAYRDKGTLDRAAGAPRIAFDACMARAAALPPDSPPPP